MIKPVVLVLFLLLLITGYGQNPLLRRHIKTDSFKYEVYVSKSPITSHHLNDSLHYHWCKAQKIMVTQGGIHGDALHGDYTMFYRNGQLAERGLMKMGLKHGLWKAWYPNGNLMSVYRYRRGKKHGHFSRFNEEGRLVETGQYRNGELLEEHKGIFKIFKIGNKSKSSESNPKNKGRKWFKKKDKTSDEQKEKKRSTETDD